MIDQLILLLQPFFPTRLTRFGANALTQFRRNRRITERFVFLSATRAFETVF
jgi:hypothetical protein